MHSGSRVVPTRWAKRIVAIRPDVSCKMCRSKADVGEASALPTPTPRNCQCSGVLDGGDGYCSLEGNRTL